MVIVNSKFLQRHFKAKRWGTSLFTSAASSQRSESWNWGIISEEVEFLNFFQNIGRRLTTVVPSKEREGLLL